MVALISEIDKRIIDLKSQLAATDYQAIKYAEGLIQEEDYAPIKAQRQAWRDQINVLEAQAAEPAVPPKKQTWSEKILERLHAQNGASDDDIQPEE